MNTFAEFLAISEKINSIDGLDETEKTNLCTFMFDTFKEHLNLTCENIELKAQLNKANREIWR